MNVPEGQRDRLERQHHAMPDAGLRHTRRAWLPARARRPTPVARDRAKTQLQVHPMVVCAVASGEAAFPVEAAARWSALHDAAVNGPACATRLPHPLETRLG